MKTNFISSLLMGVATLSIATIVSNGQAEASEENSNVAKVAAATFESSQVSAEQKAFYQVLHLDGITEEQRDQYIKQLHENKDSAQNVFSESIKDSERPERRVGQQNAFYEVLHNEDLTETQRDQYISRIKENPDASQGVFIESLHPTTEQNPEIERENKKIIEANEALKALQQEDTIQNRRAAQRAINKLPHYTTDGFQKELDSINGPRDKAIKEKAEAEKNGITEQTQPAEEPKVTPQPETKQEKVQPTEEKKVEDKKAEKTPQVAPKKEEKKEIQKETEKAPKIENKKEQPTPPAKDNKAENVQPGTNGTENAVNPSTPIAPKADVTPSKSTWGDYWNAFKKPFEQGYDYIKNSVQSAFDYLKGSYNGLTQKYNDAKYYTNLYFKYKNIVDASVIGLLNKDGLSAYIAPLEIKNDANIFYKGYANTRNFVTSGINTSRVLYTLYQNPETVKTAITVADTASKVKNVFSGILSFFK